MTMFEFLYKWSRKYPGGAFLLRLIYGCDCDRHAKIGKNLNLVHRGLGTAISPNAISGDNVSIQHHVTIGIHNASDHPRIGNNVYIGTYAMILGNVKGGDNAVIGDGIIVLNDIEPNSTYIDSVELKRIR